MHIYMYIYTYTYIYIYIYVYVYIYICVCMCVCVCVSALDPFHLQRVSKLYQKYKPVRITQKEHMLIWNSETTQKPKHLSSPNRNSYFSSCKA